MGDRSDIPTSSPYPMIPLPEAQRLVIDKLQSLPPVTVPTSRALHHIVAAPVASEIAVPSFCASVKDGYALCFTPEQQNPASLAGAQASWAVIKSSTRMAGAPDAGDSLQPGQAAYITTGAPVPPGAHAVVMVEFCTRVDDTLTVPAARIPAPGDDIRAVGSDVAIGETLLEPGAHIGPAEIGVLAMCGVRCVSVVQRPVVGVLSSGDELIDVLAKDNEDPGAADADEGNDEPDAPTFGKVFDSNRPMLLAAIRASLPFCDAIDLGIIRDDYDTVRDALDKASERCNIVLTSGGVSMGRRDVVKPAVASLATVHFGRVVMKPGKPLTFATRSPTQCFIALPGNPASCFVCFHVAVAVAARKLAGFNKHQLHGQRIQTRLCDELKLDRSRPELHRATVEWVDDIGYEAKSTGKQVSSRLLSARSAAALLSLPAGDGTLPAGTVVKAELV